MYDVIIIGAGIAGLTAALYSARQGLKTLVVTTDIGGQLLLTPEIQNYPGFISISGYELIRRIEEQVKSYPVEIRFEKVIGVKEDNGVFQVKTSSREYYSKTVILAFGKTPERMGIPGEERLVGKGVSYCVICDAPLFKDKSVALVSMGYRGVELASLLKKYASKVYWVVPLKSVGVSSEVLKDVLSDKKVELLINYEPREVRGETVVRGLVVENKEDGSLRELKVDGVFVELGYKTQTEFLKDFVKLNNKGEVVIDNLCKTSRPGVFAAGDVAELPYKQAIISAGMGATAALSAYNYILSLSGKKGKVVYDWKHVKIDKKEKTLFLGFKTR